LSRSKLGDIARPVIDKPSNAFLAISVKLPSLSFERYRSPPFVPRSVIFLKDAKVLISVSHILIPL